MSGTPSSNLELDKSDEFIILLDISGSMGGTDTPTGQSRYNYSLETLMTFVREAAKWDPTGVSFYLFGAQVQAYPDVTVDQIEAKLKSPKLESATMTHLALAQAFGEHKKKGSKQTFCMIVTDGEPSDPDALVKTIVDITKNVKDPSEFRTVFLTVGQRSPGLEKYLTDLDDNLKNVGALHDIIDVKKLEEVDFMGAVNGAMND